MVKESTVELADESQRELIVRELDRNIIVEAAAGTGKTTCMVDRMVALLESGTCENVRTLAAVTFTRKAAAELRSRFRLRLEEAARDSSEAVDENLGRALAGVEQCFIGTIHSFCARLLRERPVEAGVDIDFREIDEAADGRLRSEAWAQYTSRLYTSDPGEILGEMERYGIQPGELESAFMRFAEYPDVDKWPLGKVEEDLPGAAEALEEMKQYAAHMRALDARLPDDTGNDTLIDKYRRLPRVISHYPAEELSRPARFMEVMSLFNQGAKQVQKEWMKNGAFTREEAKAEVARWEGFRESVARPLADAWLEKRYELVLRVMFAAREVYDEARRERGVLNFQDLLMKAAGLLRENPNVREYFSKRFTHVLVDEFQDTDPIQAEMLLLLTAGEVKEKKWRNCTPRPGSLFVVGDPKQSIYRFRRADIVIFNEVKRIICEDGLEARLSVNFRSVGDIIEWVNRVFEPNGEDDEGSGKAIVRFPSRGSEESPGYVPLEKGRAGGSEGDLSGAYSLVVPEEYSNKPTVIAYEADRIARTIRDMVDSGVSVPRTGREVEAGKPPAAGYDDFMILTRKLENLAEHSRRLRRYGIPHMVTGGSALNRVAELKLLHTCLRAVARPDDPVALVAALRSELFGVSDAALYDFKVAGGRFSLGATVPPGLEPEDAEAIGETFAALKRYSGWLERLPPVAAIERVVEDSGLMALAAAGPGGDVEAGSLSKALEVLRGAREGAWTTGGVVECLGELVEMEESYDGISARPGERPAVRVMNLHKAKGLEAPVVFLADPYGESDHDVELHVDRSGGKVLGYMAIDRRSKGGWGSTPLARPAGWDALAEKEKRFTRAEGLRLRYVATTRAAAAMVITEKAKGNRHNPWKYFEPYIPAGREMPDPGGQEPPLVSLNTISPDEVRLAGEAISGRLEAMKVPTYDVRAAKEYALQTNLRGDTPVAHRKTMTGMPGAAEDDGEHGALWGTVIHVLLQVAIGNPEADLEDVARAALAENGLDVRLAGEAARTASTVVESGIWDRALRSRRWFAEVPFEVLLEEDVNLDVPTVLRGSIDLIFEEEDGWVLVDYKTDMVEGAGTARLAEKYAPQVRLYAEAWERCTGETVKETALYFVRPGELVTVPRSANPP